MMPTGLLGQNIYNRDRNEDSHTNFSCLFDVIPVDNETSVSQSSHEGLEGTVALLAKLRNALESESLSLSACLV